MKEMLNAIANFFRGVAALVMTGLLGLAGFLGYEVYTAHSQLEQRYQQSQAENEKLQKDVELKQQEITRLDMALRLLKVDHRIAEIVVLDQWQPEGAEHVKTRFAFQNVDDDGHALDKPREFTVDGDLVFINFWVIKFDDELIEQGDPLKSTSICLFRSVFGEFQNPADGFPLDQANSRPAAYGGGPMNNYERELWSNFWEYSNDSEKARKANVRAAHGEAPSIKLRPGKLYKLQLRASGGITIPPPVDLPAEQVPPM